MKGLILPEVTISSELASNLATNDNWRAWLRTAPARIQQTCLAIRIDHVEQISSDWSIVVKGVTQSGQMVVIKANPPGDETRSAIACLVPHFHPQLVQCIHSDIGIGIQVLANPHYSRHRKIPLSLFLGL